MLDVVVICGGPGAEREVSLVSGEAVYQGLLAAGITARKMEISGDTAELDALTCDVAFVVLHGEFGEDGQIQKLLEERGIYYTGCDSAASAVAMDKDLTKKALRDAGLPTADWFVCDKPEGAKEKLSAAGMSVPVVVKPVCRGSSVGTTIVKDVQKLEDAVRCALQFDNRAMVETFVKGKELTAGMLDGEILPLIELKPKAEFYDYQAKYIADDTEYLCPAPIGAFWTDEILKLADQVVKLMNLRDMSRVDFLLDEAGPKILEVNTIPGFTSHSLLPMAAKQKGIGFSELCRLIMQMALKRKNAAQRSACGASGCGGCCDCG